MAPGPENSNAGSILPQEAKSEHLLTMKDDLLS